MSHSAVSAAAMAFLSEDETSRLFAQVRSGRRHRRRPSCSQQLFGENARMAAEDGSMMPLHTGVLRNHHPEAFARYGLDTGHDISARTGFTRNLRPVLERFGVHPNFHAVVPTLGETVQEPARSTGSGTARSPRNPEALVTDHFSRGNHLCSLDFPGCGPARWRSWGRGRSRSDGCGRPVGTGEALPPFGRESN